MLNPICKLSKFPRKPTLSLTREIRLLSVTAANTDSIINCRFGSPNSFVMRDEIYTRNVIRTYKTFESETNFSAKTTSIGLPRLFSTCRLLFADQPRQFYQDETTSWHLPGLLQKPLQPRGNLLYCRAVSGYSSEDMTGSHL
jgi:hypothetical protein